MRVILTWDNVQDWKYEVETHKIIAERSDKNTCHCNNNDDPGSKIVVKWMKHYRTTQS